MVRLRRSDAGLNARLEGGTAALLDRRRSVGPAPMVRASRSSASRNASIGPPHRPIHLLSAYRLCCWVRRGFTLGASSVAD